MDHKQQPEKVYTCPMHPEIRQEEPGRCPECGMNLVKHEIRNSKSETSKTHEGHKTSSLLAKFWVAFALTVPIFFYSELARTVFKMRAPEFAGSKYLFLALGSFVFFWCGWIFLSSAYRELQARLPGMMTLIAIAISAAYLYSFFSIVSGRNHDLLFELSSLISIMLLGHWIEMKSVQSAQGALKELAELLPDQAEVVRDGTTMSISLGELRIGDIALVKPGSKIPADGKVVEGRSDVNESLITGESKPVEKAAGSRVIAGSLNGDGSMKIEIEKIGKNTFLASIMKLVATAQASKSRLQMLSDRAALYLTVIAVATGAVTFFAWLLFGQGIGTAIERLVAVLVIACPHALGLAVPLVASISTAMASHSGFLVKQRLALEAARNIDVVLFDKTGTLTKGEYGVTQAEDNVLRLAASVDANSEHFVARAIVAETQKRNLALFPASDFKRIPGKGAKGIVNGAEVRVEGSESKSAETLVAVFKNNEMIGTIALADVIREESREAVQSLKLMGVKIAMITGDSQGVASWVVKELGLNEYFSKVMPDQKAEKVKLLQSKGQKVAMVGDGINDAPALAQADLGIAIGAGTNVAIESAGIILVRNDPRDIVKIIRLSRATYSKMLQNLFWATGYNVIALPLAAGVLASKGIILQPALAAIFMSVSTVIVALNALLLKKNKI